MPAILKQRKLFVTKIFEITDNSLKMKISKPMGMVEMEFSFEEISRKTIRRKALNLWSTIVAALFIIGILITTYSHFTEKKGSSVYDILFYLAFAVLFISLAIIRFENDVTVILHDKKGISFYANKPSRNEVEQFITTLHSTQKAYYLKKYARDDSYISAEQLSENLTWLYNIDIIKQFELEELRSRLIGKRNDGSSVGFTFNNPSNLN
jgi:hypothetical protein